MSNKDFQNGFAIGLASGGIVEVEIPAKEEQEKTITITENGTTEISPDENKALSKVTVVTDVSGGEETERIVEYIESTGEQWIDTGVIPKNHRVVAKFQYTKEENKTLFGFFNNASESYHLAWYGNYWRYSCGTGSLTNVENISQCTDLQEIDFNNYDGKFLINGIECGDTNGTTTAYRTMPIFCMDHPLGKDKFCSAKLYYFKIYDRETETLVRDFIPAVDESGVICLYDNVTKAYFYNQGSGEFKAEIIEKCKDVIELEDLIDNSGVLEDTEGSVSEKVEQLIDLVEENIPPENAVYTITEYAENGYPKKIKYRIPQELQQNKIPDYAFGNKTDINSLFAESFEEVEVVGNPNIIGANAFYRCTKLKKISCYDLITDMGHAGFNRCKLSYSYLPPNLVNIGDFAFSWVPFGDLEVPASVLSIGKQCFSYCHSISKLVFKGKPETIANNVFSNCEKLSDIYCPWAEGEVANAPWGVRNATIHYNYVEGEETNAES